MLLQLKVGKLLKHLHKYDFKNIYFGGGGINKTPNKKYFMLRRCLGSKKLEYTLNTNQGTPDVYVNGVYKGTVSNGVCKWKDS